MTDEKNVAPLDSMQQELCDMWEIDNQTKNVFYYDESNNCRKFWVDDSKQQSCYRNAVPKQQKMLLEAFVILIPLLKQKTDILHPDNISHLNGFASIWCSIENIFLASTAEGYGCTLRVPLGNEEECLCCKAEGY